MAYINFNKVKVSRGYGKSSKVIVTNSDYNTIPWEKAWEVWKEAADAAEELATSAVYSVMLSQYEYSIKRAEEEYQLASPESGSYEGNWEDQFPTPERPRLKDRAVIRRKAGNKALQEEFVIKYILGDATVQILPKLVELIASLSLRKNGTGLYSGEFFLADHFTTPKMLGIWKFLMLDSKSCYLPVQYKAPYRTYSALVPFIMYAHRLAHDIPYSSWDPDEIHYVVPATLAEAMLWDGEVPSRDELIEGREQGLTVQSGATAGSKRSALSTYKLYATTGTCYSGLPEYVKVMLSQIWLAHPENRTKYMILDPKSWDSVPLPLISAEVTYEVEDKKLNKVSDLPWKD